MGMHQAIDDPDREYSRVNAYIPFQYRVLQAEERNHVRARIALDRTQGEYGKLSVGGSGDPLLEEWLKILNSKLDAILRLMSIQQEGCLGLSNKALNISGGGMGFFLEAAVPLGEMLEIRVALTFQHPVIIWIYGEVVKSNPTPDGHFVAIRYTHMDDSVRDVIVRFVFEREREIIREMRG